MAKIRIYQVDAFTDKLFLGNPAAVCILDTWISDKLTEEYSTTLEKCIGTKPVEL